ncbi:hypothetical protein TIFTF001_007686 [Ficus carica]|uniref:Uncharacterized protein n=1 Tax=Ficus carica TaxID=3494 RepID=A0AA88D134_FICCA|nr:hypothetical protein TIFTF001_007686 [Ficus carica]
MASDSGSYATCGDGDGGAGGACAGEDEREEAKDERKGPESSFIEGRARLL